jgi:hypothetical protein
MQQRATRFVIGFMSTPCIACNLWMGRCLGFRAAVTHPLLLTLCYSSSIAHHILPAALPAPALVQAANPAANPPEPKPLNCEVARRAKDEEHAQEKRRRNKPPRHQSNALRRPARS